MKANDVLALGPGFNPKSSCLGYISLEFTIKSRLARIAFGCGVGKRRSD